MIPFSNGSEAENWMSNNCDLCKRYGCSSKKSIEWGFITGEVSTRTYNWVGGFDKYCLNRLLTALPKKKKAKIINNLIINF